MTTWPIAAAYVSALVSSAATLALGYGLHPVRASFLGALSTLVVFASGAGIAAALRCSRSCRARWHQARADALRADLSGAYRWVLMALATTAVAQVVHALGLGAVGT